MPIAPRARPPVAPLPAELQAQARACRQAHPRADRRVEDSGSWVSMALVYNELQWQGGYRRWKHLLKVQAGGRSSGLAAGSTYASGVDHGGEFFRSGSFDPVALAAAQDRAGDGVQFRSVSLL